MSVLRVSIKMYRSEVRTGYGKMVPSNYQLNYVYPTYKVFIHTKYQKRYHCGTGIKCKSGIGIEKFQRIPSPANIQLYFVRFVIILP